MTTQFLTYQIINELRHFSHI